MGFPRVFHGFSVFSHHPILETCSMLMLGVRAACSPTDARNVSTWHKIPLILLDWYIVETVPLPFVQATNGLWISGPNMSQYVPIFLQSFSEESKIASEREAGKSHQESAMQRTHELEAMKSAMAMNRVEPHFNPVPLTRLLNDKAKEQMMKNIASWKLKGKVVLNK